MDSVDSKAKTAPPETAPAPTAPPPEPGPPPRHRRRVLPLLVTLVVVTLAASLGWKTWNAYMETPWTRDATVRAYVVTIAPEVAGRIVQLPITEQPIDTKRRSSDADRPDQLPDCREPRRGGGTASPGQRRQHRSRSPAPPGAAQPCSGDGRREANLCKQRLVATRAHQYQQATANLDQARVNLGRSEIRSPVNGWVTNLAAQLGDYASVRDQSNLIG